MSAARTRLIMQKEAQQRTVDLEIPGVFDTRRVASGAKNKKNRARADSGRKSGSFERLSAGRIQRRGSTLRLSEPDYAAGSSGRFPPRLGYRVDPVSRGAEAIRFGAIVDRIKRNDTRA